MNTTDAAAEHARLGVLFEDDGLQAGLSEIHGILTGLVCARAVPATTEGLLELMAEMEEIGDAAALGALLREMLETIHEQLHTDGFGFAPLLPGDETGLRQRTDELARWCNGFILGLSRGDGNGTQRGAASAEALRDIMAISEVCQERDDDEEAEMAYLEVHEHVKISVQMIFEDVPVDTPRH